MWKTHVVGHIEYYCQLWQPLHLMQLQRIEGLQKAFTKKGPQITQLTYQERLKYLKLNSQQNCLQRYKIIFSWKILENLSPNCGISFYDNDVRRQKCEESAKKARLLVKTLREQTLQVHGVKKSINSPGRYEA